jgi:hypothetical protein
MSGVSLNPQATSTPRGDKSIGDSTASLAEEFNLLPVGTKDYNLLSRIQRLYREVNQFEREGRPSTGLFSWITSWWSQSNNERVNNLFQRALDHHGLGKGVGETLCNFENLKSLANKGDLKGLQFLLSNGTTIDQQELADLGACAARNGELECLKFLLSEGRTLSEARLYSLADTAGEMGELECLKFLLSEGRTLSEESLYSLADTAVETGELECLQILLNEDRTLEWQNLFCLASLAATSGHLQCLEFLLSQRLSDRYTRGLLISHFASQGYLESIELILRQGSIERSARDLAITQASGENADRIINVLTSAQVTYDNTNIESLEEVEINSLEINSLKEVAADPLLYLNKIIEDGFPDSIKLANRPTLDLGGVSKEFVFTLFSSLASHLELDGESFPSPQTQHNKELFQKLGALLSMLVAKNQERSDKLLIGTLFNKKFYQILKLALEKGKGEELNLLVAEILSDLDESYKIRAGVILDPQNEKCKQDFADAFGCELEEVEETAKQLIESYSNAALWILSGADEAYKAIIESSSLEALCLMIQGEEATSEEIKNAIRLDSSMEEPTELLIKQRNWLFEILDESDLPWRKNFLTYVTGRDVLVSGEQGILLRTTAREEYPEELKRYAFEFHTCSNSIDLPNIMFSSKEDFLAALNNELSKRAYTIA